MTGGTLDDREALWMTGEAQDDSESHFGST